MYDKATICVWGLEAILNAHRIGWLSSEDDLLCILSKFIHSHKASRSSVLFGYFVVLCLLSSAALMVTAKAAWLQPIVHIDTCKSSYIEALIAVNTGVFTGSGKVMHHWQAVQLASIQQHQVLSSVQRSLPA